MLVTLRNTGAKFIVFVPDIKPEILLKILDTTDKSTSHNFDRFIEPKNIISFVLVKDEIDFIHLVDNSDSWNKERHYEINIKCIHGLYRIGYGFGENKPDFFKRIFQNLYPEISEKQIEELI